MSQEVELRLELSFRNETMIDEKGAFLYAAQLYNLLAAEDPAMVLGNPITRAVLISLVKDLASMPTGSVADGLRQRIDDLRTRLDDGGEIFIAVRDP